MLPDTLRRAELAPSAGRVWVLGLALGLALTTACSKRASQDTAGPDAPAFREVKLSPSGRPLAEVLEGEARAAKGLGLTPFVELGATWCKPCRELEASMADPLMKDAFKGTYVVHLDIDEWGSKLGPAGLGSASIPVFIALDASGKVTGRRIDGGAWEENIPRNMAPKLSAFFRGL